MKLKLLLIVLFFSSKIIFSQEVCLELFHENGNPKSIEYFNENEQQIKDATYFFDNKQLHYKEKYENNYKVGTVTIYYRNGKVNKIIKYSKKGTRRVETTFNKSGSKKSIEHFLGYKKDGKLTYYYKGKISREENYKNNKKHGKSLFFYKDGNKYKVQNYNNGKKHGLNVEYYSNKKIKEKTIYNEGVKDGIYKYYYKNGIAKYILEYEKPNDKYRSGKLLNVIELNDINGTPLDKGTLKDGNGIYYEYDDKGKVLRAFDVVNGVKKYKKK